MHDKKNFPEMEEEILRKWKENSIFEKSIQQRESADDFVFYDGPPFATGLPHHGHILASTAKDVVGRYKTMRGYRVLRRWGWDCHGLPIENLIEKELGISGKKEIEEYGIDKFCNACEASVLKYDKEWEKVVERIGRFVDFTNNYKTMDHDFMESVWWGFKQLWGKNLVYQDTRISLYCPRCETPLSNFEIAMDNSYKIVTDPSVYVRFPLVDDEPVSLLVWTTTPWTLPANAAVAVNPKLIYAKIKTEHGIFIVAEDLIERLHEVLGEIQIVHRIEGVELVGKRYTPIFNHFRATQPLSYTVVGGDFVTITEGTGLVHIAPSFGEDDYRLGKEYDLDFFETVDSQGKFLPIVAEFKDKNVWNINNNVIDALELKGNLVARKNIKHEYPFCWRCDTKLIYKTQPAWFIAVHKIKDRMLQLNEAINWYPEHLKHGRFGKGLETAPDWNISRSRFWGNPLPVWVNDVTKEIFVAGSIAELEEVSGMTIKDLHRPGIDEIKWEGGQGGVFKRIPEVFDCWFESGSMPWASVHYPFENKEFFEKNYPAEFISEYIAQTRGWFYTMHVLATAIFDKPSFVNAVTTGTILSENGEKMSKSKKNFTSPQVLIDQYGVDSMRYYLMASPLMKGENLRYADKDQADVFRKVIMLLWNVYSFYELSTTHKQHNELMESPNILDRWIVSKLNLFTQEVTQYLDVYDLTTGTRLIGEFIDELSTWYIRRNRDRLKGVFGVEEQEYALNTTYYVLLTLSKVIAPIIPFIADELYQKLQGPRESVHLEDWPEVKPLQIHTDIVRDMAAARAVIEKILALRAQTGMKIRQALGVAYMTKQSLPEAYHAIIADEVNVQRVEVVAALPAASATIAVHEDEQYPVALDIELTDELRQEGDVRELTRYINSYRKELQLTPADRITLYYETTAPELQELFAQRANDLQEQVKADELLAQRAEIATGRELDVNGLSIWIGIEQR